MIKTPQHIRSFVRRQSRLTKSQKYAIDSLWKTMGIGYQEQQINLDSLFSSVAPVILEIGFGMGTSLVTMASSYPEKNFLGIEVHLPGIGSCLAQAKKYNVDNLRLMYYDAVEVLKNMIQDQTLELVQLFFPDPWHKVRHNKRRIIQPHFVELIGRKLVANGIFHVATDWKPYAEHILTVTSVSQHFRNISPSGDYMPRPINRPYTKFEYRGQRLGHMIWDLMFTKSINRSVIFFK